MGNFPRKLLFGFDLTVGSRSAFRLPLWESAGLHASHLVSLGNDLVTLLGDDKNGPLKDLLAEKELHTYLRAICGFESGPWRKAQEGVGKNQALAKYLFKGLCDPKAAKEEREAFVQSLKDWQRTLLPIRTDMQLRKLSDSPVANPLLALPILKANKELSSLDEVDKWIDALVSFYEIVRVSSGQTGNSEIKATATTILDTYRFYGSYWTAIAECLVPLDEPFLVNVSETREVTSEKRGNFSQKVASALAMQRDDLGQVATFGDAYSNHVSLRVSDASVEFDPKSVRVAASEKWGNNPSAKRNLVETRHELILVYSPPSTALRPHAIKIDCRLRPLLPIRMIHWVVTGIALVTFLAITSGGAYFVGELTAPHVALLLTPSTFATAVLLARESTSLSAALLKPIRVILAIVLAVLWLLAICQYLAGNIHLSVEESKSAIAITPLPFRDPESP
ncbi:hypothetical protein AB0Q90_05145 [Streptomyces sp. NPDC079141]|uniref:hypothetical protein n=1 Tax=Streptomyces sp. NPDC079141 TaxID=3155056 RepID=UPI00341A35AD